MTVDQIKATPDTADQHAGGRRGASAHGTDAALTALPQSLRGLDWLNFFVANAQTGFGPFIAVYLTTEAWTQVEIGEVLSLGTAAAMLSQIPGGAVVDRLRDKRVAAGAAGVAVAVSAILFAAVPTKFGVMLAEVLHSFASCMLGPALAAMSLTLVGEPDWASGWVATRASPRSATASQPRR